MCSTKHNAIHFCSNFIYKFTIYFSVIKFRCLNGPMCGTIQIKCNALISISPQLDVDGMLRKPLVPEAVRNLNLGNFDGRNLDAGHLDGGRDGGRGDRHANDKHNGQNQCKKFSHSSFLLYFAGLNADSYKYIDRC